MRRLALVGGGYSAVALLLSLAEQWRPDDGALAVDVFEPSATLGQGLAYAPWERGDWGPLLNVPAGRMGPTVARQDDFAQWWRQRGGRAADFAPRAAYGRYLAQTLHAALAATPALRLTHHRSTVQALAPTPEGWQVRTDAAAHTADDVVLCTGHEARGLPPGAWSASGWWSDPWSCGEALDALPVQVPVLLIGSGLTAVDVWQRLMRRPGAAQSAPVTLLSRHGWLPQPHRPHDAPPPSGFLPDTVLGDAHTARQLLRGLRQLTATAGGAGLDWRDVMADLRRHTPRLWHQLPVQEQRRAVRHGTAAWDSHRHRAAPEVAAQVAEARRTQRLQVIAGRLVDWAPLSAGSWQLQLQRRDGTRQEAVAGAIVNCTGPAPQRCAPAAKLRQQGLQAGWYRPHANGLGPAVDAEGRMLHADGHVQSRLWCLGPALRAAHWEATAVPELRQHAQRLAQHLAQPLLQRR
ncbi:FAD/NAD(P)-binding protein [Roseateles sp. BYS87W]|uniref:FAD/NAD(P)-binding protein n=1 Tax=Pelomonas baiyunensis TaxID=3299026 RepID=A0ABW7H3B3_9BURK